MPLTRISTRLGLLAITGHQMNFVNALDGMVNMHSMVNTHLCRRQRFPACLMPKISPIRSNPNLRIW